MCASWAQWSEEFSFLPTTFQRNATEAVQVTRSEFSQNLKASAASTIVVLSRHCPLVLLCEIVLISLLLLLLCEMQMLKLRLYCIKSALCLQLNCNYEYAKKIVCEIILSVFHTLVFFWSVCFWCYYFCWCCCCEGISETVV